MLGAIKKIGFIKRLRKNKIYFRLRPYFGVTRKSYIDEQRDFPDVQDVKIAWPQHLRKPHIGIVRDFGVSSWWTRYKRFLENNQFEYSLYDIHKHNWLDQAKKFGLIIGIESNEPWHLEELKRKYFVLEKYLNIWCYPSYKHVVLYEDKSIEAYISQVCQLPFIKTFVSYSRDDAVSMIEKMEYPFVSKVIPSSGSVGVELIRNRKVALGIIDRAFSLSGRRTHVNYLKQKNYVYFQEYVQNDGYDIRVIMVGNMFFGYYRKVLDGDFRASGMGLVEKRDLPIEAMDIARKLNNVIKSPMIVVDMLRDVEGSYHIIEYSPVCRIDTPEQLHVNGVPGVYLLNEDGSYHFEAGKYWVQELVLKDFLSDYCSSMINKKGGIS